MEYITNTDHKHTKRVWEDFRIQNLGQYLDLSVQTDTLLQVDVFERVQIKCIEIYEPIQLVFYQHKDISMTGKSEENKS